jgi:hypothetical protein
MGEALEDEERGIGLPRGSPQTAYVVVQGVRIVLGKTGPPADQPTVRRWIAL